MSFIAFLHTIVRGIRRGKSPPRYGVTYMRKHNILVKGQIKNDWMQGVEISEQEMPILSWCYQDDLMGQAASEKDWTRLGHLKVK